MRSDRMLDDDALLSRVTGGRLPSCEVAECLARGIGQNCAHKHGPSPSFASHPSPSNLKWAIFIARHLWNPSGRVAKSYDLSPSGALSNVSLPLGLLSSMCKMTCGRCTTGKWKGGALAASTESTTAE